MRELLFGVREPLTDKERRLVLRAIIAISIPMALIVLLVAGVTGFLYRNESNKRIADNQKQIQINAQINATFNRRISEVVYEECVAGELRDVILVQQLRAAITRTRQAVKIAKATGQPIDQRFVDNSIQDLQDGINALEPDDEKDCTPPLEPKGKPR